MFVKTLASKNGQYGLECMSLVCRWISVDAENNPTTYDPELFGTVVLFILLILMVALNVATYIKVRVIKLDYSCTRD